MRVEKEKHRSPALSRPETAALLALFGVGLALRILYLLSFSSSPLFDIPLGADVHEYDSWAREIVAGRWLWRETPIHAPLYPYFLACLQKMSGFNYGFIRFVQTLLNMLVALPLFFFWRRGAARRRWPSPLAPWLFLGLYWLLPSLFYFHAELICESLALPLICLDMYFLARAVVSGGDLKSRLAWLTIAGLFAGLAVITHPLLGLFALFSALWILFSRAGPLWRRFRKNFIATAVFCCAAAIPVVPVCAYNSWLAGSPVLIQKNSGFNFFLGNNPDATGGCYLRPGPEWDRVHRGAEAEAKAGNISKDGVFVRRALNHIRANPGQWLLKTVEKAFLVFNFRQLTAGADSPTLRHHTPLQRHLEWLNGILIMLGLAGCFMILGVKSWRRRAAPSLLLFGAMWLGQTITVTSARYRLAMTPAFCLFAAIFIADFFRDKSGVSFWRRISLIALAAVIVYLPKPDVDEDFERIGDMSLLGEAWLKTGDKDRAETLIATAIAEGHRCPRNYFLLGAIRESRGDFRVAERLYLLGGEADPESCLGDMNIAVLKAKRGDLSAAEKSFALALAKEPDDPELLYNLALHNQKFRNRKEEAETLYRRVLELRPGHRRAMNNLGALLAADGRLDEARRILRRAVAIEPGRADSYANLAVVEMMAGDRREALRLAGKARRLNPDHPLAAAVIRRLERGAGKR